MNNRTEPMNYLVVQHRNGRPCVRVVPDGTVILDKFEAWPLDSGKRILAVESRLPRALAKFHIGGSFHGTGAQYAQSYDDLVLICTEMLGEHERARYERLRDMQRFGWGDARGWIGVAWAIVRGILFAMYRAGRFVLVMLLVPVLIGWIGGGRGRH